MNGNPFAVPATTIAEHYDIATWQGRANLFAKRMDELMKPKAEGGPGLTTDEAVLELRISQNPDDQKLLEAMGEAPSLVRSEKLQHEKFGRDMTKLADENARAGKTSPEVAAAVPATNIAARNSRALAFNFRISELARRGLSLDQAILRMQANPADAALLAEMGGPAAMSNSRALAFNARISELAERGFSLDQAILQMRANPADAALLSAMGCPDA